MRNFSCEPSPDPEEAPSTPLSLIVRLAKFLGDAGGVSRGVVGGWGVEGAGEPQVDPEPPPVEPPPVPAAHGWMPNIQYGSEKPATNRPI